MSGNGTQVKCQKSKPVRISDVHCTYICTLKSILISGPGQKPSFVSDSGYSTVPTPDTSTARVYATPTVATRPFIPCFKAAATARPSSSLTATARGFFPTAQPMKPTFTSQAFKSNSTPKTTATSSASGPSTASRAPSFGPSFSKSVPSQPHQQQVQVSDIRCNFYHRNVSKCLKSKLV